MSRIRIRIQTPSRLHFGLLAWGPQSPRLFGGVGLMIEAPRLELWAEPAPQWNADGPLARRVLDVAERIAGRLAVEGVRLAPVHFRIQQAPAEHVGLGVGTQLSLAVARALFAVSELPVPSLEELSALTGRGQRSGIGLHGFVHGGLIVDGGRCNPEGIPPLLSHVNFPPEWAILVIQPRRFTGFTGSRSFVRSPSFLRSPIM
jgi:beta-RFAP synthase